MEKEESSPWDLRRRILALLSKEATSDVEFLVGDTPTSFRCHRAILAAGSPVFEAMFFGLLKQGSPVRVPDIKPEGFRILLKFLYSDAAPIRDDREAFEAAYASRKYLVWDLFDACEDFLLRRLRLDPEGVVPALEAASLLEMSGLCDRCLRYVSRNALPVFRSASFERASGHALRRLLSLNLMDVESESQVVEALWRWGRAQCAERPESEVRDRVREFLRHVRLLTLGLDELSDVLERCRILDTSEELALLWNVAMPRTGLEMPKIPSEICPLARKRSILDSPKIRLPGQYQYDGSLTSFVIERSQLKSEMRVTGNPVTVVGVVVAFRPIPCYSRDHRSLDVDVEACHAGGVSRVRTVLRAEGEGNHEERRLMLLDDFVVVGERQAARLTVTMSGEGVRLRQCAEDSLCFDLGGSQVSLSFEEDGGRRWIPVWELIVAGGGH